MSQSRCQPRTDPFSRRRAFVSPGDRRTTIMTPLPMRGPPTPAHSHRVASVTTNYRDRPNATSRPQSSEHSIPARKTPPNPPGRTTQPAKQLTRQGCTGNRKSSRHPNKRPPFVVGTGNTMAYRCGVSRVSATTKTEIFSRSSGTSLKERGTVAGSVPKVPGTELKKSKSEKPAVHGIETMTLISSSIGDNARQSRDRAATSDVTDSSATFIVDDPLPEVFLHRADRKQIHPSADECIKQVAEKLVEFAAKQSITPLATKSGSGIRLISGQRSNTGNDVTKTSRGNVTESPHPLSLAQGGRSAGTQAASRQHAVPISGGDDPNGASRRFGGVSKKVPEVSRTGPTRLAAACQPSPTRSSLLRQALNCPRPAARQQRAALPTRQLVDRSHRSATEVGTENQLRQHVTKQGRADSTQNLHDAAARPKT